MQRMNLKIVREVPENSWVLDRPRFITDVALAELGKVWPEVAGENVYLKKLDTEGEVAKHSSPLITGALHDVFASYGARPAIPVDDADGKISAMVHKKHYSDFNALVVQSAFPTYDKNKSFLENLIGQVEDKVGSVKFPFMITGFGIQPAGDNEGYNLYINTTGDDFKYVQDDRLARETGSTFKVVDKEVGLPEFCDSGTRTWYRKTNGASRLYLYGDLRLGAYNDNLSNSDAYGRVALVAAYSCPLKSSIPVSPINIPTGCLT